MQLKLSNGEEIAVDKVVVAAGLKPSTELAVSGRMEVDPVRDGFVVNSELLARSDIWVVCITVV
ncbi:MAG: FAD-dependent oxidoreductase [Proteobacteria bacterium]|nr:FAD-dependent oxidoreductase [Pseudomonadota bacterium]